MRTFSIKLAIRKLLKQKSFTFINLGGLSISLAACIIIFVYASYEWSFDKNIPEYNRTYRIISGLGDGKYWARSFACYTYALSNRPEIESMTSFIQTENNVIRIGEDSFWFPDDIQSEG
jgi:putative ABC transport system permease protein